MKRAEFDMKRIAAVLAYVLILGLGACGVNDNSANTTNGDTIVSREETSPEAEGPELEYKEIGFGELISLAFVEITIDGMGFGDEIRLDNPNSAYGYMHDTEGEKYVYLYGTIKNASEDQYEFADNIYAQMIFDGEYSYSASIVADEEGGFSYIYAYLDPLKSEKFYMIASIPDDLAGQYAQVAVKFGFAENFDGEHNIQENQCDYLYSMTITK